MNTERNVIEELRKERKELNIKANSLNNFLGSKEAEGLSLLHIDLMKQQLKNMFSYSDCLLMRIEELILEDSKVKYSRGETDTRK